MSIGARRHRVRVESPTSVADGVGGYADSWSLVTPGVVFASIVPATAQNLERFASNTVTATASHVLEMRYLSGLVVGSRVRFGARVFDVVGLQNPQERNITHVLACVESQAVPDIPVVESWVQSGWIA